MKATEHFKGVISLYKAMGFVMTETNEQIILKGDQRTFVLSLDKEAEEYMSFIDKISILYCEKKYEDIQTSYKFLFQYKEDIFIFNFQLVHQSSYLLESLNVKTENGIQILYERMKDAFQKDEVLVLKEIILRFRDYIASKKEHRLRLLFKPLTFGNSYDWILSA